MMRYDECPSGASMRVPFPLGLHTAAPFVTLFDVVVMHSKKELNDPACLRSNIVTLVQ